MATANDLKDDAIPPQAAGWLPPLLGGALAALLWSPMLFVPFYHDDWGALYHARQAIANNESLMSSFAISDDPGLFWRPISVGLHWRFIAGVLQGNAFAAHVLNLLLLIAACAAVGNLAANIAKAVKGEISDVASFFAAFLYGIHGAMFLPVAWTSGAQELYAILFSALALKGFGTWCLGFGARNKKLWICLCPVFLALALLSKEGTAVVPLLAVILMWMLGKKPKEFVLPVVCAIVWIAWFVLRMQRVAPVPEGSPYSYQFGFSLFRNFAALGAFSVNFPREALQVAQVAGERSWLAWGAVCAVLQAAALGLIAWRAKPGKRIAISLAGFWCVSILPVLPLAWNCYPYYALIGLMAFSILVAMADGALSRVVASLLAMFSGLILMAGQFFTPYPATLASAYWGDQQLKILQQSELRAQSGRYAVELDERSFGAMGNEFGIATALDVRAEQIARPQDSHGDCDYIIHMPQPTMRTMSIASAYVEVRGQIVIERRN